MKSAVFLLLAGCATAAAAPIEHKLSEYSIDTGLAKSQDKILGLDVLERYATTVDPQAGTITLRPRGKPHGQTGVEIPFELLDGKIVAKGKLVDRDILWWINTGFNSTVPVHASLDAYQQAGVGVSTAIEKKKVTIVLLSKVSAGAHSRSMTTGLAGTFPGGLGAIEGILSAPFFGTSAYTIDFDRRVILIR